MGAPGSDRRGAFPAVAVIDGEGIMIGWSPAAEELTGYAAADILGRPVTTLLLRTGTEAPDVNAARDDGTEAGAARDDGTDTPAARSDGPGARAGRSHGPATEPGPDDRAGGEWSGLRETKAGLVEVRRRNGERIVVRAEVAPLATARAGESWLVSAIPAADDLSGGTGSLMESLISLFPVAMAIWDRDLRCVWLNAAAGYLEGVFPHYHIGRSLTDRIPGTDTEAAQEAMRKVLADGTPMIDREARWVSPDGSEERTLSTSLFRLEGLDGQPLGVCSLALDISSSRARDRLALLREASVRIGSTLDIRKTAQELADLAVPILADYVTVDLSEVMLPDAEPLQRLAASDVSIPVFRRAGVASVHDGVPESLWPIGEAVFVPPGSPFTEVLATRRPHFEAVLDTSPGTWLDQDPARARIIHGTGMHSLLIVPLEARGDILGVAVFVRNSNPAPFTRDDLVLAEELVARAALSLDNARRYTRERNTALALQRDLLPRDLCGGAAVEVASRYLPSDVHEGVGGDWYDAIRLPGARIALVVGDVTGHGINAAATMGRLRTAVRTLSYLELPPDQLLAHLDRLVADDACGDLDVTGATCLYAIYDAATRRCTMAAAGHPPPAVVTPAGEVIFPPLPSGTPIGLGMGSFESHDLHLAAGTVLALYTDGLIETRQADLDAGMARLGTALAGAAALPTLESLCASVVGAIVGDGPAEDDVALLMARTRA
ncbi:PAS domain S-box-containing protein [Nonomuraea thailandensis]|uniref:protein-serine/threonine phosphatase n=1 Tax=Nonomuraea thailandensis TaxID=1188745 RepID=A0A9X2K6E3_9ACTN|nr:SpoIIE family protein phosphatase [Nonomuraea thailandensis]MCP2358646.1 PAS domain S-box-containing protein [Nonomuraea thailandensis]